jgi:hypothetical protein
MRACVLYVCVYIFFMHSLVDGHLGWFRSLVIVSCALINIGVKVSQLYADLHSLGIGLGVL